MNHKLNFLKCFACFGVVFIHIPFPTMLGKIIANISAFAVPIFFMIAGYYAFERDIATIRRRLIKILKILLFAYLVFFVYTVAYAFITGENIPNLLTSYFNCFALIKAVCFCTIDFAIPLWYLIAMVETYMLWYFIVKRKAEGVLLKLMPVLFVLQILLTSYCDTLHLAWFLKINFITRALPWFLFGYYMHTDKSSAFRNMHSYKLIILAVLGSIITTIPVIVTLPIDFSSVGYIPYAIGLFTLCLKKHNVSISKPIEYIGKNLSLYIYIFHIPMGSIVGFSFAVLGFNTENDICLWCKPLVVLCLVTLVSWVMYLVIDYLKQKNTRVIEHTQ